VIEAAYWAPSGITSVEVGDEEITTFDR